jgi:hypothetical protein
MVICSADSIQVLHQWGLGTVDQECVTSNDVNSLNPMSVGVGSIVEWPVTGSGPASFIIKPVPHIRPTAFLPKAMALSSSPGVSFKEI